MKRGYSIAVTFYVIIFLVLFSYSMKVEGVRALKDESSPSFITLIINQAYSGPSHRGRGH
ncbi:hypothetical protein Fmac_003559 [Flemingia macrophylla]|uniref:Uncharacterized protein n=1 Tax=Flemingia macrophylla TaxID=520843 RepID=A0ABD1NN36_9FABA